MQIQFYKRLVKGYLDKTLTKEELAIFLNLLSNGTLDPYLSQDMDVVIKEQLTTKKSSQKPGYLKYAAVFLLIGFVSYFLLRNDFQQQVKSDQVRPGYAHAVLRMADGTELLLDTNQKENVVAQNGVSLSANADGLVYDLSKLKHDANETLTSQYSSIETPKGGAYHLVLSDGTKVWLNAFSKLKFPLLFNGDNRIVEIEGEVYFEVAENKSKPFIVKSRGQEIKVLGTIFNVNTYLNEDVVKTTLIEGSISLHTGFATKVIKPGQEVQVNSKGLVVKTVDASHSLAWKEGFFKFDKLYVSDIMRQVERWYNIEVVYNDSFKDERFVGKIKRSAKIDELIYIFNEGGLKVSLKDRKLYVSNSK